MRAVMSSRGFTSAFAAELEAYLAFKASMGFYGTSRIWYLKRFDAYCSEHNRTVFDRDTVEEWVGVQLQHSGRYRSWMSYICDVGRWLSTHGATDAYVLSYFPNRGRHRSSPHTRTCWQRVRSSYSSLPHSCGLR